MTKSNVAIPITVEVQVNSVQARYDEHSRLTLTQCIDYNQYDNQNLDLRVVHNISAHFPYAVNSFHCWVRRNESLEPRFLINRPIVSVGVLRFLFLLFRRLCLAIIACGNWWFKDGHRRVSNGVSVGVVGLGPCLRNLTDGGTQHAGRLNVV